MATDIEEGLISLLGADPSLVMGRGIGSAAPSPAAPPPSTVMLGAPAPTAAPTTAPTSPSAFAAAPDGFPYAAERDWWLSGGPDSMGKALLLEADRQRGPGIFSPWYAEIRRRGLMNKQAGGALVPGQNSVVPPVLNPIISAPIPPPNYGMRVVPPSSEAQQRADYDYTLNTLKGSPIYPGANFANVDPQGYNVGENTIQADQGLSPFIQQNLSAQTGQTTGGLSQVLPNPGNTQGGLSTLNNARGAFS